MEGRAHLGSRSTEQPLNALRRQTEAGRAVSPFRQQLRGCDAVVLGFAGPYGGDLAGGGAGLAALAQVGVDLVAPLAERVEDVLRDAADVGDAVDRALPLRGKVPGECVAKRRLVDVARGLGVRVDQTTIERRPLSIRSLDRVCDQDMRVELWVSRARRPVFERGREEPRPANPSPSPPLPVRPRHATDSRYWRAWLTASSCTRRIVVRTSFSAIPNSTEADSGTENIRSKPYPGPGPAGSGRRAPRPLRGRTTTAPCAAFPPGPHGPRDRAVRPQHPSPVPRRLRRREVVVLDARGDALAMVGAALRLVEVVALAAGSEFREREHLLVRPTRRPIRPTSSAAPGGVQVRLS
ncbi:hypothetical protein C8N24_1755 [Solirubrobacter pauli]|uniref:Uncharacterized protein n=1 Tax=Solirubrobacter pauli TaxID=166793 RepID=A0A660LDG9_9ACTN|nr:hypothetical protein C8N24_1755 [Solirubrobacter pauli]